MVSVVNQFKIVNNSNGKGLKFHWANSVSTNISVNNITLDFAGGASSSNIVTNLGGFKRLRVVEFVLYNDGTDKSTTGDNIITLADQRDYLLDTIIEGKAVADSYSEVTFTLTTFADGTTHTITGGIDSIGLDERPSDSGVTIVGTITIIRGGAL